MKYVTKTLLLLSAFFLLSNSAFAVDKTDKTVTNDSTKKINKTSKDNHEPKWERDFEKAKKISAKSKKPILMNFSGSDWCVMCIELDKNILSKKEFKDYARDNLVLFVADFPRTKKLPEKEVKQNEVLAEKYRVGGFPTILVLDTDGELIGRQVGYPPISAKVFVDNLKRFFKEVSDKKAKEKSDGKKQKTGK